MNMGQITRYIDISMIPVGRDHAITRQQLCTLTGKSDRKVRDDIAWLRRKTVICSSSSGKGYYRPSSRADIEGFINETTARAENLFLSLKKARNVLKTWYQPDLLEEKNEE